MFRYHQAAARPPANAEAAAMAPSLIHVPEEAAGRDDGEEASDFKEFVIRIRVRHADSLRAIQWIEKLVIGCMGTEKDFRPSHSNNFDFCI